jgi:hypothetical protein
MRSKGDSFEASQQPLMEFFSHQARYDSLLNNSMSLIEYICVQEQSRDLPAVDEVKATKSICIHTRG